jgi:hypothetical protein
VSAIRKLIETAREQSTYFPRHSYSRDVLATEADAAEAELKELEAQLGEQGEDITDMKAVIGNQQEQLGVHARADAELSEAVRWFEKKEPFFSRDENQCTARLVETAKAWAAAKGGGK